MPQFHEVATIPVIGRPDGLRVILTADGILGSVVGLLNLPRNRDRSPSWQRKVCCAVGLLYDYLTAIQDPPDLPGRRSFLSDFVRHLIGGTIQPDGSDPTGLFWRPAPSWTNVQNTLSLITLFSDYCCRSYESSNINPITQASFSERVIKYRALDAQNSHSLLRHLRNAKANWKTSLSSREIHSRREPNVSSVRPPYFPHEKLKPLLEHGFRRTQPGLPLWSEYDLRDIMIVMLERFGGLRSSEPFHLFTTDVREDPDCPGHAQVRLYHPELGLVRYADPLTGRIIQTTRAEFLRQQYGREPRNRLGNKERAGWKNLMLDEGNPQYCAHVRWFPREVSATFWEIYKLYITYILPPKLSHPYLLVTLDTGINYGRPYQMASYYKNLRRAVERIGLDFRKALGTTSHGFRHAYGQSLMDAKLSRKAIQVCLHHISADSQEIYTRPEMAKINQELEVARRQIASLQHPTFGLPEFPGIGLRSSR